MVLIGLAKAAKSLSIDPRTLRVWIGNGKIKGKILPPGKKGERRYLIDDRTIEDYLSGSRGEFGSVAELMAEDIQESNKELRTLIKGYRGEIVGLRRAVFEQINIDKRSNPEKKIETLMTNQSKLYDQMKQILTHVEHLSNQMEHSKLVEESETPFPPNQPSPAHTRQKKESKIDWRDTSKFGAFNH